MKSATAETTTAVAPKAWTRIRKSAQERGRDTGRKSQAFRYSQPTGTLFRGNGRNEMQQHTYDCDENDFNRRQQGGRTKETKSTPRVDVLSAYTEGTRIQK